MPDAWRALFRIFGGRLVFVVVVVVVVVVLAERRGTTMPGLCRHGKYESYY